MRYIFTIGIVIALSVTPALAGDALRLTLQDAVDTALRQNLTLDEEALLYKAAEADLKRAEGEFDPALNFSVSDSYQKTGAATQLMVPETRALISDISLGGKTDLGTGYELKWSWERVDLGETPFLLINPYYTSNLAFTVSQPLLKGFGRSIQESRIKAAKDGVEAARLRAARRAADIKTRTITAYWDLYYAKNSVEVGALSLKLAENMLNEIKAKIETGELAQVEIYGAEAEVAIRRQRLLMAQKAVHDASDGLISILNGPDYRTDIELLDAPKGPSGDIPPLDSLLSSALEKRRDLRVAMIGLESARVMSAYYRDWRRPDLSLIAGVGLNGLGDSFGSAIDDGTSGDFYSWQAGLKLNIPLRGRVSSGDYQRAKSEEDMAELKIKALKQAITVEVREAHRAVVLARESINATEKTRLATHKRLEAEEARFRVGMSTVNDVLRYQTEFTDALASERKALVDFEKASATLMMATE